MTTIRTCLWFLAAVGVSTAWVGCDNPTKAPGNETVLASVGATNITEADLNAFAQSAPPAAKARLAAPGGKKQFVEILIDRELLFRAGDRAALASDPMVQRQIAAAKRSIIADTFLRRKLEEKARAYFEAHPEEFTTVELSHILIRSGGKSPHDAGKPDANTGKIPAKPSPAGLPRAFEKPADANHAVGAAATDDAALQLAGELKARIIAGESFADLAKQYSADLPSKESGGKLGNVWRQEPRLARRGMAPLLDIAFRLKPGEVGGPIKTESGYHVLTVSGEPTPRAFDDVKEQLLFRVQSDTRREVMQELRKDADITWVDSTLKNPEPSKMPGNPDSPAPAAPGVHGHPPAGAPGMHEHPPVGMPGAHEHPPATAPAAPPAATH